MHPIRAIFLYSLLALVGLALTGCDSAPKKKAEDNVSTLPWNTPEKWEKTAPIGGGANY